MATLTYSFTIDNDRDRDLVRFLDGFSRRQRSEAIRETLRAGMARGGITIGDVYQVVKELERKLSAGVVVNQDAPADCQDAPADVLAALDGLGL